MSFFKNKKKSLLLFNWWLWIGIIELTNYVCISSALPRTVRDALEAALQWWSALTDTCPQSCFYKLYLLFSLRDLIIFEITSIISKERVAVSVGKNRLNDLKKLDKGKWLKIFLWIWVFLYHKRLKENVMKIKKDPALRLLPSFKFCST